MAVFIIPVIRREDYDAFRRDVGAKLANTYDEWAKLFEKETRLSSLLHMNVH